MAAFESTSEAFARTGRCESASVAYRHQPIAFSAVWISVHTPKNESADTFATFASFCKLQGVNLDPPLTGQINSR